MTQFIVEGYPAYAYTGGRPHVPGGRGLVFVHGAANDHSVWHWPARYFAHHGFTVLAPDLPAHGRSPGSQRASVEALADWIAGLLDAAGLARADVVGHSLGSLVALDLALRHRARVGRVALVNTAVPMEVGEPFLAAARDDSPAAFDMAAAWSHARHVELRSSPVPGLSLHGASRQLAGRSAPGVQHTDLRACRAYAPSEESIAALDLPVLVVGGAADRMAPPAQGRALAAKIAGARFALLETGHVPMAEAPVRLVATLRAFLGS